ncbi:MAG: hypothetical protein ABIK62_04650, partial [candidate division WOR-3 bacterium]
MTSLLLTIVCGTGPALKHELAIGSDYTNQRYVLIDPDTAERVKDTLTFETEQRAAWGVAFSRDTGP